MRKNGELPWLRPDAKSQVTFRYENGRPVACDAVVFSTQHSPDIYDKDLKDAVMDMIIKPILPAEWLHKDTQYPHQPDRQVRHRRPDGRLRSDRPQNHRRYLRRHGPSRWRCVLR